MTEIKKLELLLVMNELSVLSLNCWGLHIVSKKRKVRLEAIAHAIAEAHYDVVTLQEVWMWSDVDYIKNKTGHILPYAQHFYSGTLGSGLVILSRFPIVSSQYHRYTLAGRPLKIFHGDYYVGKGCGSACIDHPDIGLIDVFTTHLHAGYGNTDEYEAHRISESWEIARLVRSSACEGRQVIVTGDFNSTPSSYNYQLLRDHAFMTDSWLEANSSNGSTDELQRLGITCDSPRNTWSKRVLKQNAHDTELGDRLDYIFYRRTPQLTCIRSCVAMTDFVPNTLMSFSDHFAVHSTFAISPDGKAIGPFAPSLMQLRHPSFSALEPLILHNILELFQKDQLTTRKTAMRLLYGFVSCVLLVLGIYVAIVVVSSIPSLRIDHPTALIVTIVCGVLMIVLAAIAPVCLIVGFVFGHAEHRALRQFIAELQLLLEGIQMQGKQLKTVQSAELISLVNRDDTTSLQRLN